MADEWCKYMENRRNNSNRGKPSDKNLSQSHPTIPNSTKTGLAQNRGIQHVGTATNLLYHGMTEFFTSQE